MRFIIKQKYWAISDSFMITDANGNAKYLVKGKLFTIGKKFWVCAPNGQEILFIKERLLHGYKRYDVLSNDVMVAKIKRRPRMFSKRLKVTSETFGNYIVKGNIMGWDFHFNKDDTEVATTSKQLLKFADTYTLDVAQSEKDYFIIAIAIVMDAIFKSGN